MSTNRRPGALTLTATLGEREIRVERVFDAPRDRVWRALTDPSLIAQWWGRVELRYECVA